MFTGRRELGALIMNDRDWWIGFVVGFSATMTGVVIAVVIMAVFR
jgi:hypothetical protein